MRVFVTGASGWIGSAAVDELLAAGHEVTGLARSDASAAALEAKGVRVRRGDLDDLASIRAGAEAAEAVIHLANKHDLSNPAASNAAERAAVQTIGDALAGTDRPFLLASGVAALTQGRPATEDDASPFHGPDSPRGGSENLALEFVDRGVRTVSLRFAPTVHGTGDHGFIAVDRRDRPPEGRLRLPRRRHQPVGRSASLRRRAPGRARAGEGTRAGARLHAVAEEGIPTREIAEAIGRAFDLPVASIGPEDVQDHFGWIGTFFGMDLRRPAPRPGSSSAGRPPARPSSRTSTPARTRLRARRCP